MNTEDYVRIDEEHYQQLLAAERERDAAVSALTRVRELCEYEDGTLTAVQLVEAVLALLPPVDSPEEP